MSQAPALTGQDIAEAEGAVTRLLERALAPTGTGRHQYVVLRVLTGRGPFTSPGELHEYLAGQPQLGLTPEAVAAVLAGLEVQGLAAGTALDSPGPALDSPARPGPGLPRPGPGLPRPGPGLPRPGPGDPGGRRAARPARRDRDARHPRTVRRPGPR